LNYIEENKKYILDFIEWSETIEDNEKKKFIKFLTDNEFFQLPASINHHSNYTGGLADHSIKVEKNLIMLLKVYGIIDKYNIDFIRLIGLFHDLCKIDRYEIEVDNEEPTKKQYNYLKSLIANNKEKLSERNINSETLKLKTFKTKSRFSDLISWLVDNPDSPPPAVSNIKWKYSKDSLPFGHGEKSALFLQKYISNLPDYVLLAIRWHMSTWKDGDKRKLLNKARKQDPVIQILPMADQMATIGEDISEMDINKLKEININN